MVDEDTLQLTIEPPLDDRGANITHYMCNGTKREYAIHKRFYGYDMVTSLPLNSAPHMRYDMVGSGSFTAVSVSLWLKTTPVVQSGGAYYFSWATTQSTNGNAFFMGSEKGWTTPLFYVESASTTETFFKPNLDIADNEWHHVSVSLSSNSDNCFWLIDNIHKNTFQCGTVSILKTGTIVLGQEQDSIGGGFDSNQAFYGRLSMVRVYGSALSHATLSDLSLLITQVPIAKFSDFQRLGSVTVEKSTFAAGAFLTNKSPFSPYLNAKKTKSIASSIVITNLVIFGFVIVIGLLFFI